jgi:hypothetical protein
MDPMSDGRMTQEQEHLTAQECQAMAIIAFASAKMLNTYIATDSEQNPHCMQP